jgi:hypothetical protein
MRNGMANPNQSTKSATQKHRSPTKVIQLNLNLMDSSGTVKACNGIALLSKSSRFIYGICKEPKYSLERLGLEK